MTLNRTRKTGMRQVDTDKWAKLPLTRLNAVRTIVVLIIAIGYASTMSPLAGENEVLRHLGYDPSRFGLQILFCLSGYLAVRSLTRHGSAVRVMVTTSIATCAHAAISGHINKWASTALRRKVTI